MRLGHHRGHSRGNHRGPGLARLAEEYLEHAALGSRNDHAILPDLVEPPARHDVPDLITTHHLGHRVFDVGAALRAFSRHDTVKERPGPRRLRRRTGGVPGRIEEVARGNDLTGRGIARGSRFGHRRGV